MKNPYEPPSQTDERTELPEGPPPTLLQKVTQVIFFSAGSIIGLNAAVAADEGLSNTIQRTTIDPGSAIAFFTCVATVCVIVTATWKKIRGRLLPIYRTTNPVSLATGFSLTFVSYIMALYAEHFGLGAPGSIMIALAATAVCVVELEALVMRCCSPR